MIPNERSLHCDYSYPFPDAIYKQRSCKPLQEKEKKHSQYSWEISKSEIKKA